MTWGRVVDRSWCYHELLIWSGFKYQTQVSGRTRTFGYCPLMFDNPNTFFDVLLLVFELLSFDI